MSDPPFWPVFFVGLFLFLINIIAIFKQKNDVERPMREWTAYKETFLKAMTDE